MTLRPLTLLLAVALAGPALALAACNTQKDEAATGEAEPARGSLASLLADKPDLSSTAHVLEQTGLSQVLDEAPYYTVLAPTNAAMTAFASSAGQGAQASGQDAALAAVMRAHILPGYLTADDIAASIDAHGGTVTMTTMADSDLSFSRDGEALRVTAEDGSTALLSGSGMGGTNGVILPVDTVLKQL